MMAHPLLPKLRELRLSGMLLTLEARATQATERGLTPTEFLALLLDDELERRHQHRLALRMQQSGCDGQKTLAHFDFAAAPGVNRTLIQELAACAFIGRHENILFCGPTGVGKSHLANGLAYEALKRNYRVLCRPIHRFLADVHASHAAGTHARWLSKALMPDLLVLDDFGLQPLLAPMVQDLYDIICERYERGSIIITSNRALEEWGDVFGNELLANAALDRLTHHAHTVIVRGQSYRQRSRRKEVTGTTPALPAEEPPKSF